MLCKYAPIEGSRAGGVVMGLILRSASFCTRRLFALFRSPRKRVNLNRLSQWPDVAEEEEGGEALERPGSSHLWAYHLQTYRLCRESKLHYIRYVPQVLRRLNAPVNDLLT